MNTIKLSEIISISFTLFAIIDVPGNIPAIISIKKRSNGISPAQTSIFAGALMIIFLFLGNTILTLLGLDVQSFALAGSVVIFLLGLEMILGIHIFKMQADGVTTGSLVPVGFPLLIGAGTLTVIISMRSMYSVYNILIAVLINILIMYFVLRSTNYIERKVGETGLHAITKFFGVVSLALAIKIFRANFFQ